LVAKRKRSSVQIAVEGLEGRELLAANFTLVDTLTAKDTLDIQRLDALQQIETLRVNNAAELQAVISSGGAATQDFGAQYTDLKAQEADARAAGDRASVQAIRQEERQVLQQGNSVRQLMRQATAISRQVSQQLLRDEGQVNRVYNQAVNNLGRRRDPFLIVPHATTAIDNVVARANQHADKGTTLLTNINDQINGGTTSQTVTLSFTGTRTLNGASVPELGTIQAPLPGAGSDIQTLISQAIGQSIGQQFNVPPPTVTLSNVTSTTTAIRGNYTGTNANGATDQGTFQVSQDTPGTNSCPAPTAADGTAIPQSTTQPQGAGYTVYIYQPNNPTNPYWFRSGTENDIFTTYQAAQASIQQRIAENRASGFDNECFGIYATNSRPPDGRIVAGGTFQQVYAAPV